jgi:hypothetical protein
MTHNENPAAAHGGTGLPQSVISFGGEDLGQVSPKANKPQGHCPLFNPRTREQALHTAQELNAAAQRCKTEARSHPGATGLTLDRLAGHYAGMARDWFGRADGFPSEARA